MNKKQSLCGGIVAIIILALAIIVPLFTPLITGEEVGNNLALKLDSLIKKEYDYQSSDGDYYDYDGNVIENEKKLKKIEVESKRLENEYDKVRKYGDDFSFSEELSYLGKLINHYGKLEKGYKSECTSFLVASIAILVFVLAGILYSIIMIIKTVCNLVTNNMTMHKASVRIRNLLFFLIPLMLVISFQRRHIFSWRSYYSEIEYSAYSIGIGFIIVLASIVISTIFFSMQEVAKKESKREGNNAILVMITAITLALIMSFAPGIIYYSSDTSVGTIGIQASYGYASYGESLDLEDDENMIDEYEEWMESEQQNLVAGVLLLVTIILTILMLGSMSNAIYKNRRVSAYPFMAVINIILYFIAIKYINDAGKIYKSMCDATSSVGVGIIALVIINITILIFEGYRIIIDRNANKVAQIPEQSNQVWQYMPQQETPIWNTTSQQSAPTWQQPSQEQSNVETSAGNASNDGEIY